jgi:hypothetical protein
MACEKQKCAKCGCNKPVDTTQVPDTLPMVSPAPAPVVQHHYHREDKSSGFWKYMIGFTVGWLFMGC